MVTKEMEHRIVGAKLLAEARLKYIEGGGGAAKLTYKGALDQHLLNGVSERDHISFYPSIIAHKRFCARTAYLNARSYGGASKARNWNLMSWRNILLRDGPCREVKPYIANGLEDYQKFKKMWDEHGDTGRIRWLGRVLQGSFQLGSLGTWPTEAMRIRVKEVLRPFYFGMKNRCLKGIGLGEQREEMLVAELWWVFNTWQPYYKTDITSRDISKGDYDYRDGDEDKLLKSNFNAIAPGEFRNDVQTVTCLSSLERREEYVERKDLSEGAQIYPISYIIARDDS